MSLQKKIEKLMSRIESIQTDIDKVLTSIQDSNDDDDVATGFELSEAKQKADKVILHLTIAMS